MATKGFANTLGIYCVLPAQNFFVWQYVVTHSINLKASRPSDAYKLQQT